MSPIQQLNVDPPKSWLRPPKASSDQINPCSNDHLLKVEQAAEEPEHPQRDLAIHFLLFDSGTRASELWVRGLDLPSRHCSVRGS